MYNPTGFFRGNVLIQKSGKVGKENNVFVALPGNHDDFVYPEFGAFIANPPKGATKMWAGDLLEFRPDENGNNPRVFVLRTFKVIGNVSSATTVNIERGEYRHRPFVGDILMVEPTNAGTTGTGTRVTDVVVDKVGGTDVWTLTLSDAISVTGNTGNTKCLIEADKVGSGAKAIVQTVNGVLDSDLDFVHDNNIDTFASDDGSKDEKFLAARYQYTPALGGLMWKNKMRPIPAYINALNDANVNGWFHIGWRK